ncbi:hypothetical protein [Aureispira anguillae]|uniref:Uncharacterized protein n=1 Tax=Aureispira anguillae TaxID=2864201 RepID=A0A916DTI7_9BACT|nr:hypothetical protein [Aureispira anguillae]BDS11516.1 hypothetical protein AsAng_0022300 [Aureispira anguillae]
MGYTSIEIVQQLLANKNIILSETELAQLRLEKGPKKKHSPEDTRKWAALLIIGLPLLYILIVLWG